MLRWGREDTASISVLLKSEINVLNANMYLLSSENILRSYYKYKSVNNV